MSSFFAMGGYAAFVWPAYAIVAIVLVGLLVLSVRVLRRNEATLRLLEEAHAPRRAARRAQRAGIAASVGSSSPSGAPNPSGAP